MLGRNSIFVSAVLATCTLAHAAPTLYFGSLSTDNGLIGTGQWATGPITMSWNVTQDPTTGLWTYRYEFERAQGVKGALSHLILETSTDLTRDDIMNATPGIQGDDPRWYNPQSGNPGMPGDIFGVMFEDFGNELVATILFDSTRSPMWGDFYAKDGKAGGQNANALWNAGFGTGAGHLIAVPNTVNAVIPAPGAIILGSIGSGLVSWLRRRRMF